MTESSKLNPDPNSDFEPQPLPLRIFLWVILAINILLNAYIGLLLIGFLIRALTPNPVRAIAPNYVSMILPALSVVLTIVSSIGTGLLRRWAAIVFLVLTVLGMLSLFNGSFNAPGLSLYFLSLIAVILSWRWLR
jgi:hypothetical protein